MSEDFPVTSLSIAKARYATRVEQLRIYRQTGLWIDRHGTPHLSALGAVCQ